MALLLALASCKAKSPRPSYLRSELAPDRCQPITTIDVTYRSNGDTQTKTLEFKENSSLSLSQALQSYEQAIKATVGSGELVSANRSVNVQCKASSSANSTGLRLSDTAVGVEFIKVGISGDRNCQQVWNSRFQSWECDDGSAISFFDEAKTVVVKTKKDEVDKDIARYLDATQEFLNRYRELAGKASVADEYSRAYFARQSEYDKIIARYKADESIVKSSQETRDVLKAIDPTIKDYQLSQVLEGAMQEQLKRAEKFSGVANLSPFSDEQIRAFNRKFVDGLESIDRSIADGGVIGNDRVVNSINQYLIEYASVSVIQPDVKAGYKALLEVYSEEGIIVPKGTSNEALTNYVNTIRFKSNFDSPAIADRRFAAELRQSANSLINRLQDPDLLNRSIDHLKQADDAYLQGDKDKAARYLKQSKQILQYKSDLRTADGRSILNLHHRRNDLENRNEEDESSSDEVYIVRSNWVVVADASLVNADSHFAEGRKDEGELALTLATTAIDIGLGLIPGVGWAKDVYEAALGKSLVTGEPLSDFERTLSVVGVLTGGYGSKLGIAAKASTVLGILKTSTKEVEAVSELAHTVGKAEEFIESASSIKRFGPLEKGPLHFIPEGSETVAETFRSGSYYEIIASSDINLYRVYGGKAPRIGSYWSTVKPSGPLQAQLDAALLPEWKNTATELAEMTIPKGTKYFRGATAPQALRADGSKVQIGELLGGGDQIYIPKKEINNSWLKSE